MNGSNLILVDWDGTCVEHVWPGEGDWLPGAVKALGKLASSRDVMIYSARVGGVHFDDWSKPLPRKAIAKEVNYIRRMLDEAGLYGVGIFEGYPNGAQGKPGALAYIDDRAVPFNGSWVAALGKVKRLLGD